MFFNTDEFGVSVTYNGGETPITGVVEYGDDGYKFGSEVAKIATLWVKASDVASPSYRDTAVISGTTWRVYRDKSVDIIREGDGSVWRIPLMTAERPRPMP